jgi:hypothetical protein
MTDPEAEFVAAYMWAECGCSFRPTHEHARIAPEKFRPWVTVTEHRQVSLGARRKTFAHVAFPKVVYDPLMILRRGSQDGSENKYLLNVTGDARILTVWY